MRELVCPLCGFMFIERSLSFFVCGGCQSELWPTTEYSGVNRLFEEEIKRKKSMMPRRKARPAPPRTTEKERP